MMIFINECYKAEKVNKDMIIDFIKILSPFTPLSAKCISIIPERKL